MAGPLKTLFGALQASSFLGGVTLIYGDEETNTQRFGLPAIIMIARGGPYVPAPGYARGLDPNIEMVWEQSSNVDFWLWAASSDPVNQGAIDHTDAVDNLEVQLLSALQDQKAQGTDAASIAFGLQYRVVNGQWQTIAQNAVSRYNRAYVLTVQFQITKTAAPPTEATITSQTTAISVNHNPP